MHTILGATGHVGSAVTTALLEKNEPVTVVTRDAHKAEQLTRRGAAASITDVHDTEALRAVLQRGHSAFLLMPPADPSTDTVAEERRTVASIVRAVTGTRLQKIVMESTYGAQPGDALGDLSVLFEFEQAITALKIPTSIVRAAYYMSNWDSALDDARDQGIVRTFFPVDFVLPMAAPADLGRVAARLLSEDVSHTGVRYVEGPERYSPRDVAAAFAQALGRQVQAVETPRSEWVTTFRSLGFSPAAAESYARMTAVTVDALQQPASSERGPTSLTQYVNELVRRV